MWLSGVLGGLQTADPVIASLALPQAGKGLGMTASHLALAASISTLFLAATVVLIGAVADRIGRRKMMAVMTVGVIAGDVLVALAPQTTVYMIGRAVAGVCVGGVLATSYAYVRTVAPPDRLGASLGLWGAINFGLALPLAVAASAFASLNWRLAFLAVPAVALACLPLESRILPKLSPTEISKQLWGVSLAGLGVVGVLWGVSQASNRSVSPETVGPIVVGLLLLASAGVVGMKSKRPAFPVRIFRSPVFLTAAVAGGLWNLATGVAQLQSSNLWQYVHGISPLAASLLQLPYTVAIVIGSIVVGRQLGRGHGPRGHISLGLVVVAIGFGGLALTGAQSVGVLFNMGLVAIGLGAGFTSVAQSQILLTEAPGEFVGPIAASRTTFGQIGYALGLAGSSVVTMLTTIRMLDTPNAEEQLNAFLTSTQGGHPGAASQALADQVALAYTSGFQAGMWLWAVVFVLGAVACFVLMSMRHHPLPGAGEPEPTAAA